MDVRPCGAATAPTSSITIRNLDAAVQERLRVRAAEHGHSMEAEARDIAAAAVGTSGLQGRHAMTW